MTNTYQKHILHTSLQDIGTALALHLT